MSEELRLGLIGAGRAGEAHLRALRSLDGVRLAAVVDPDQAKTQQVAHGADVIAAQSLDDRVAAAIDAAVIATPSRLHLPVAARLLSAGIPVLVEKPLSSSFEDARAICELAERRGVLCMAGQVLRFMPVFERARHLIASGKLGRPIHFVERRLCRRTEVHPWWRQEDSFLVHHWGSHSVDLLLWLLNTNVERAFCEASAGQAGHDGEDDVSMLLGLANGAKAGLHYSFASRSPCHDMILIGERATFRWEGYCSFWIDEERQPVARGQLDAAFRAQLSHFIASARGLQEPLSAARSALPALQALSLGLRSTKPTEK